MVKTSSSGKSSSNNSSSSGTNSGGSNGKRITGKQREAAGKGVIKEEFLRKKDELFKLKSLDGFILKNLMGTNPKKSDMKPELKEIVRKLKAKSKTT